MTDIVDKATRSRIMSQIRGQNTAPERIVRRFLHKHGFRFRVGRSELPGRPDVVLPRWRTAIFVHGCFWHQHRNCRFAYKPKTNKRFWEMKFRSNVQRDKAMQESLRAMGWLVHVVWECRTSDAQLRRTFRRLLVRQGESASR